MKTTKFNQFRNLLGGVLLSVGLIACDKDNFDGNNNATGTYTTASSASGNQTTPPTTTSATATLFGEYNINTNNWEYRIQWTGLSSLATAVQIHGPADVGVSGDMMFALTITTPGVDGRADGSLKLDALQESYLLANKLYFTVINATHVTGEVRGQIVVTRVN